MLDQSFSEKNLLRLIKENSDIYINKLGRNREEITGNLNKITKSISEGNFDYKKFKKSTFKEKIFFSAACYENEFVVRKINDNIRRLYKISQSNRGKIIEQVHALLSEDSPKTVIRLDIEKFYESIPKKKILELLYDDPLPSIKTKELINKLLQNEQFKDHTGLPRGLSLSATLAEYYLRDFDNHVNRMDGVYYYARYVDDIIIFSFKKPNEIRNECIKYLLENKKLKINRSKSPLPLEVKCSCYDICNCRNNCKCARKCKCDDPLTTYNLDYLGYKFIFNKSPSINNVVVSLADKKIKKIKSRLTNSFLDFIKNDDFNLLNNRVKFLTGNYKIHNSTERNLNSGIYYNYSKMTDMNVLSLLNDYLNNLIYAQSGYIGIRLNQKLNDTQRKTLRKNSFSFGFKNKIIHKFDSITIKAIKKAW